MNERLLEFSSVIGLEPTHLTEKLGQWLLLVNKFQKDNARTPIDQIINNTIFPESQVEKPSRANRHNINTSLVTYATILPQANTPISIKFYNLPENTVKRKIQASYDIAKIDTFPNIENKKIKSSNTTNMDSNDTHTTTSLCNEESTSAQSLSREEFLQILRTNNN